MNKLGARIPYLLYKRECLDKHLYDSASLKAKSQVRITYFLEGRIKLRNGRPSVGQLIELV